MTSGVTAWIVGSMGDVAKTLWELASVPPRTVDHGATCSVVEFSHIVRRLYLKTPTAIAVNLSLAHGQAPLAGCFPETPSHYNYKYRVRSCYALVACTFVHACVHSEFLDRA